MRKKIIASECDVCDLDHKTLCSCLQSEPQSKTLTVQSVFRACKKRASGQTCSAPVFHKLLILDPFTHLLECSAADYAVALGYLLPTRD